MLLAAAVWTVACSFTPVVARRPSGLGLQGARVRMSSDEPLDILKAAVQAGFPQGKQIKFGLFTSDVDPSTMPSEEERARLRERAAADMSVIDDAERARRTRVGYAGAAGTAALAAGLLVAHAPLPVRAALIVPIWLFNGYIDSGRTGL
jgi:hypothetical protein